MRGASAPLTLSSCQYPGPMVELYGDSARGADWAVVRLRVDGDRIVDSDAPGIATDLRGLSLLEAAAVGGELLPVDALANALGPAIRATRSDRVAVAMSGGVDSAVTLLKAGAGAVGVTLRLWLDPHGPDSERACCSPSAVIAARDACHARRAAARDARPARSVSPRGRDAVRARVRPRGDPESMHRLQRRVPLRGAARIRQARRCSKARDRPLRTHRRARGAAAARPRRRSREGPELHARAARSTVPRPHLVPARRRRRRTRRARRPPQPGSQLPSGPRARKRASSPATTTAPSSAGRVCRLPPGRSSTRGARRSGRHDGYWRFTPGQRRGLGVAAAEPLYAIRPTRARTPSSPGLARRSPGDGSPPAASSSCPPGG